jgi:hypothetical protein
MLSIRQLVDLGWGEKGAERRPVERRADEGGRGWSARLTGQFFSNNKFY